jgi:hypothetical protein
MVTMIVRKKPASCGCSGQTILVKLSFQAQKPTAVPIKLAISVIFQVAINAPSGFYATLGLLRTSRAFSPSALSVRLLSIRRAADVVGIGLWKSN